MTVFLSHTDSTITINHESGHIIKVDGNHVIARGIDAYDNSIIVTVEFKAPMPMSPARFVTEMFGVTGERSIENFQERREHATYEDAVEWARAQVVA